MPRKRSGRRGGRRRGRSGWGQGSVRGDGSSRLLADMRAYHAQLAAQCASVEAEMSAISTAMRAMGAVPQRSATARPSAARPARGRGGRPIRGPRGAGRSLKDYIAKVVSGSGQAMRLVDITNGVKKSGYQTSSKNLSNQVSMALADMARRKRVRKVARGMYSV